MIDAMATNKKAATKAVAKKAAPKKAALPVFNPASIPVLHYELQSFKTVGRSKLHKRIAAIDVRNDVGLGAAAILTNEKDAPRLIAEGKMLAYVGQDLCIVTTDMALIEHAVKEEMPAEFVANAMAFYREHIGEPILADQQEYGNVRGTPYGIYRDCIDQEDFDAVDADMTASYEHMLFANAQFAKKPMGEPTQLFDDIVPGFPLAATILNLVVGAHEHDRYAKEWHELAIKFSNVWKMKHGLSKVDHACPKYRAFTRNVWMQHKYHRGLAALARAYLSSVAEKYAQESDVQFSVSPHALAKRVAPKPAKVAKPKRSRAEELDEMIPF
jgi:hypothetical protein